MVKCLGLKEIEALYNTRIKADFPRMERRPLSIIRRLYGQGRYLCLVLEEAEQVLAYATFICDDAVDGVLLDYYAVDKKQRGGGIGSRFLSLLVEYWREKSGIVLECERPDCAKSREEALLRKRRIDFYLRGGAEETPLHWRLFGVDYSVLWLPTAHPTRKADVGQVLMGLYARSLPPVFRRLFTRLKLDL